MSRAAILLLVTTAVVAQTDPKPKPEDYPAEGRAQVLGKPVRIGAEFMVHSFSRGEESYIAPEFLVVEVALFPQAGSPLQVNLSQFMLRINGKKRPLMAQPPQLVASSLTHPEWRDRPRVEADAGVGGMGVGLGRPRPVDIPGMPPQPGTRLPNPPPVPKDNPSGMEPRPHVKPEELVVQTALPELSTDHAVSGFLYFAYKGKTGTIQSLELLYEDAVIKLR